jgi:hypothetical protein
VRVVGVDDKVADGNVTYTIITTPAISAGTPYDRLAIPDVTAINEDNDDRTIPVVTIQQPVNNGVFRALSIVEGIATDAGPSGVVSVYGNLLRLANPTTNQPQTYINAAGNPVAGPVNLPAVGTTSWTLRLPLRLLPGRYRLTVIAVDGAGNRGLRDLLFTINNANPVVTITSPQNNRTIGDLEVVRGTAVAGNGLGEIASVSVRILQGTRVVRTLTSTLSGNGFTSASAGSLPDGTYTVEAIARDRAGNEGSTRVTVTLDRNAPVDVAITSPQAGATLDNLFRVDGTASDAPGGSGLDRVELVIRRRSDDTYFNGRAFVERPVTADGKLGAEPSVRAQLNGNTWTYALPSGLPVDPDPLNAIYSLTPVAYDRAGNKRVGAQVNVTIRPNGTTASSTAATSPVKLSTGSVSAAQGTATLTFTGALNADAASDASRYSVSVNGRSVQVEGASYRAVSSTVTLTLPEGAVASGSTVVVTWSNVQDAANRTLNGNAKFTAR